MPEYSNYLESLDPVVGALSGDEIIGASKDGDAVSLTAQQIANLGGGGGTWGSITGTLSNQTDLQSALDAKQPIDSDLTAIAALAPSNDDVLQRKAGAWTNRTLVQLGADLQTVNIGNLLYLYNNFI